MFTFAIGLIILLVGGFFYGRFCERVFAPDERTTPSVELNDGVDFVPMKKWRCSLVELLNIAGTGPILGPIQGILFGPIAFLTIPIGCVIGGAVHDYFSGMISIRNKGAQMPTLVHQYLGKTNATAYRIFTFILLFLVGAVFIYTPGDIFVSGVLKQDSSALSPVLLVVYLVIFLYYIIATLLPIDRIIGKVYPIFGLILLLSTVFVAVGMLWNRYPLDELWTVGIIGIHPGGQHFIPIFFVTVACGIVSGFHATQSTLISRTLTSEKHGRRVFYGMMIGEGFIAMIWAAAAMGSLNLGVIDIDTNATNAVSIIADYLLGSVAGIIAILGVVVLSVTSGDTALRSLRLMLDDVLHISSTDKKKNLLLAVGMFTLVAGLLLFSKRSPQGFQILWRYFAWANQVLAVFTFAMIARYLKPKGAVHLIAALPGTFYMFIVSSYLLNAQIGFRLNWTISYILAALLCAVYLFLIEKPGKKKN